MPGPIRTAILNDYEIVVLGLAALLGEDERFEVVEVTTRDSVSGVVDLALYDTFGAADPELNQVRSMVADPRVGHVVVFTWNCEPTLIDQARENGVSGYLSKELSASELKDALQRVHEGETVVATGSGHASSATAPRRWPGQGLDITEKEADVLALITRGFDNKTISEMLYISPNTLKTRVRNLYRKLGVDTRVQAALWGVKHGFEPDNAFEWDDLDWVNS